MRRQVAIFALCALVASTVACRRRRRAWMRARTALPPPALFVGTATQSTSATRWISRETLLAPFVAANDGWIGALEPSGRLRWASQRGRAVEVRESRSPCQFDASRHTGTWTIPSRLAFDGRGVACCAHDGSPIAPAGVYCARLDGASVRWRRARTQARLDAVSSGDGAIALYGRDVLCTRDAGETMFATFRGDEVQRITMATCTSRGAVLAVAGMRSLGGEDEQTLRRAHVGGALEFVAGSPRGNPVDLRVRDDGSFVALLERGDGAFIVVGPAEGPVTEEALDIRHGRAIGNWGSDLLLVTPRTSVRVYGRRGFDRARAIEGESSGIFFATTRVGRSLVGVTRDGTMAELSNGSSTR